MVKDFTKSDAKEPSNWLHATQSREVEQEHLDDQHAKLVDFTRDRTLRGVPTLRERNDALCKYCGADHRVIPYCTQATRALNDRMPDFSTPPNRPESKLPVFANGYTFLLGPGELMVWKYGKGHFNIRNRASISQRFEIDGTGCATVVGCGDRAEYEKMTRMDDIARMERANHFKAGELSAADLLNPKYTVSLPNTLRLDGQDFDPKTGKSTTKFTILAKKPKQEYKTDKPGERANPKPKKGWGKWLWGFLLTTLASTIVSAILKYYFGWWF